MKLKSILKQSLKRVGIEVGLKPRFRRKDIVFLHIGKNAGTQFKQIAKRVNTLQKAKPFRIAPHHTRLTDLPIECEYIFSIRDPVSRYKSAFYSRKRQGLPAYHNKWTNEEREAFTNFEHANCLAEALSPEHPMLAKAIFAMNSIGHLRDSQIDWFKGSGNFFLTRPPIYIMRQENFVDDLHHFLSLQQMSNLFSAIKISDNATTSHSNNYEDVPPFSEKATQNLKNWYHQDYLFLKQCEEWIRSKHNRHNQ